MLCDFLFTVSHLELELLVDSFELLKLEDLSANAFVIFRKLVVVMSLIVFSQIWHSVLSADLSKLQVDPDHVYLLKKFRHVSL